MIFPFIGCNEDLLEKTPVTTLNPSIFWSTEQDALAAVNNLYTYLPVIPTWINREMITDFAAASIVANINNTIAEGTADSGTKAFQDWWEVAFKGIAATNYFLENVDKVKDLDELLSKRMKAEARFIRAFIYLTLAMDFGDVPLLTRTVTVDEGSSVTRNDKYEIFDFIISEMDEIESELPTRSDHLKQGEIGRVTNGAAFALKARTALFAGTLAKNFGKSSLSSPYLVKSVEASEKIISSGEYGLYNDYNKLFSYNAEYSNEIILSRNYAKDLLPYSFYMNYAPYTLSNRSATMSVTRDLIDKYEMKASGMGITKTGSGWNPSDPYLNRDSRLEATVFLPAYNNTSYCSIIKGKRWDVRPGLPANLKVPDVINSTTSNIRTGYVIKKYINEEDAGQGGNDGTNLILIRYADVLLMYAEAKIELNQNLNLAKEKINMIRLRAGMPAIENSGYTANELADQSIMRSIVRNERSVELALEGLRLFDIRRWKIAENVMDGYVKGFSYMDYKNGNIVDVVWNISLRKFDSNKNYLFPIPAAERSINPSLTQNPGY